jgi:hypothetical protein
MDKRTARREYGEAFSSAIATYRSKIPKNKSKITNIAEEWTDGNIRVFVRKRPIFKHETDNFEFDVATCVTDKAIVIHDCRMGADMKKQLISHNTFEFDTVFSELTNNEIVYENTAKSLVNITVNGGFSTCLVYGQTGSGKTFTMTSIYEKAARDIFLQLHDITDRFSKPPIVSMSFVEIAGDRCSDLLNGFQAAQLLTSISNFSLFMHPNDSYALLRYGWQRARIPSGGACGNQRRGSHGDDLPWHEYSHHRCNGSARRVVSLSCDSEDLHPA